MATQAARRAQTRRKLIHTAKKLFEKQGFEATSVDQLIKLANVAKGTFYQHFKTKLDVLIALEREANRDGARTALAAISEGAPALPILEKYLESLAEWFEAREKIAEALTLSSLTRTSDETTTHPELSSRGFIHAVLESAQKQGTIREDTDAWELTRLVGGFIAVSVIAWSRNPQPGLLIDAFKGSLRLFLEGAWSKEAAQ